MKKIFYKGQWVVFFFTLLGIIALFYLGFYKYLGTSDSSTLTLENTLLTVKGHKEANIIVLGDSTASVEVRTNLLNERINRGKAINLGMPGSWFYSHYLMQDLVSKENKKVDTVILLLGPDEFTNNGNRRLYADLQYHKTNISILDSPALFTLSDSPDSLKTNLASLAAKPVLFKTDLQDLVMHPLNRVKDLARNIVWLNRRISASDPLWEDGREFDVCNLGPLNALEQKLEKVTESQNTAEIARYKMNVAAYLGRKVEKHIDPSTEKNLRYLLAALSDNFAVVYVLNAPIYEQFEEVYPAEYLAQIARLTEDSSKDFENIEYIAIDPTITQDCANFMDVVHLSRRGGTALTEYLADYLNRRE